MTTAARIKANRENSKHSTGPKTAAGKAASSRNHRTHGLSSADPVLPTEDRAAYHQLLENYTADWTPTSTHEHFLVEQLAAAGWKLKRLEQIEDEMFATIERPGDIYSDPQMSAAFERMERHRTRLERTYHRAIRELRIAKKEQNEANSSEVAEKKYDDLRQKLIHDSIFTPLPSARELGLWPPKPKAAKPQPAAPENSEQK